MPCCCLAVLTWAECSKPAVCCLQPSTTEGSKTGWHCSHETCPKQKQLPFPACHAFSVDALRYMQALLENHMGMHVDNMRRFADTSPADRGSAWLPNARLPKRGFYRIKSLAASQLQKQPKSKPPSFRFLPCWQSARGKPTAFNSLSHSSAESVKDSELDSKVSVDVIVEDAEVLDAERHADLSPIRAPVDV